MLLLMSCINGCSHHASLKVFYLSTEDEESQKRSSYMALNTILLGAKYDYLTLRVLIAREEGQRVAME